MSMLLTLDFFSVNRTKKGKIRACAIVLLKTFFFFEFIRHNKKGKCNFLRWQTHVFSHSTTTTTSPAEWITTEETSRLRKLITNVFRACSPFFIRWSSYNNNANGLNKIVLNNHFLSLPLSLVFSSFC